jgi:hypothetical protein
MYKDRVTARSILRWNDSCQVLGSAPGCIRYNLPFPLGAVHDDPATCLRRLIASVASLLQRASPSHTFFDLYEEPRILASFTLVHQVSALSQMKLRPNKAQGSSLAPASHFLTYANKSVTLLEALGSSILEDPCLSLSLCSVLC